MGSGWSLFFTKTMIELLNVNLEIDELEIEFIGKELKVKKVEQNKI